MIIKWICEVCMGEIKNGNHLKNSDWLLTCEKHKQFANVKDISQIKKSKDGFNYVLDLEKIPYK